MAGNEHVSAEEFAVLEFCSRECRCGYESFWFAMCNKCLQVAKGVMEDRCKAGERLMELGYIEYRAGNSWSLTAAGLTAYTGVLRTMESISKSASLFAAPDVDAERKSAEQLGAKCKDMARSYNKTLAAVIAHLPQL